MASVPLGREIRTVGRAAVAPQHLSGEGVGGPRPPLEIGTEDRVVPAVVDHSSRGERAHVGRAEVVLHTEDADIGLEVLLRGVGPSGPGRITRPPPRSCDASAVNEVVPIRPVARNPRAAK